MKRNAFIAAALLSAAGVALSLLLIRQHAAAHAGLASACNLNAFVNCDRVATSRWSVFLGLPVAVWGLLGYGLAGLLALAGLGRRRAHEGWPAGLLFMGASAAAAVSIFLALVSELGIGALCLYCAGSWLVSFGLFAAAWRACRPEGIRAAIRADLALLGSRPVLTLGTLIAMGLLVALAASAQDRYWERPPPPASPAPASGAAPRTGAAGGATRPSAGPIVVVEFSDYECPFCARAHEALKGLLAGRTDVTFVKRHFPLDAACNPIMKRQMHPQACALALGAICAERQGRFAEMDDALFANQQAKRPLEEVAVRAGLDLPRFRACLVEPETARRLSDDIATGIQIGLKATPTYVVNGVQYEGLLPPSALPPP